MGDEARRRLDEIKFRNTGGNMEGIAGFNLTYNDEPEIDERESRAPSHGKRAASRLERAEDLAAGSPRRHAGRTSETAQYAAPINPYTGKPLFQNTVKRAQQRASGKTPGLEVIAQAKARKDGAALRASDGLVLRQPLTVRLKGH